MNLHLEQISRTMREASTWCELRLDEHNSPVIRSAELNPDRPLSFSDDPCRLVNEVCATRSKLLNEHDHGTAAEPPLGRFLLYYPHLSLSDGAAELVSKGFFDTNNEPRWDVWVFCDNDETVPSPQDYGTYLLCWIPNRLVDLVEQGIQINPEGCLKWAAESKHPFAAKLRSSQLFGPTSF
jgi:hypothetical protein